MRVGKRLLEQTGAMFPPETLLNWNRWFIARKYEGYRGDLAGTITARILRNNSVFS